jgi:hypothetical protein
MRLPTAFAGLLLLSACVGPDLPPPLPLPGPAPLPSPPDCYPPVHADEYRSGYDLGRTDARYGYPRDPRRAYTRYGRGYESFFQEGYLDGYDGRSMRH